MPKFNVTVREIMNVVVTVEAADSKAAKKCVQSYLDSSEDIMELVGYGEGDGIYIADAVETRRKSDVPHLTE